LFYQWGWKDPFPGAKDNTAGYTARAMFYGINQTGFNTAEVTVTGTDNAACIIESIQKPTTFFSKYDYLNFDWLKTSKNDLWNIRESSNDIKTIYDPCSYGWRVPAFKDNTVSAENSPWNGYNGTAFTTSDTAAMDFGTNAIYPAAGYRYPEGGANGVTGIQGLFWSSKPNTDTGGHSICFQIVNSGLVREANQVDRGYGLSVRCMRE
jgi:hypothetical protein